MTQPMSVTTCNLDLENLITDVNRSIATLAITTLLKVGKIIFNNLVHVVVMNCKQVFHLHSIVHMIIAACETNNYYSK